ncbi:MAG: WD40 repeat domain-containing protein [Candidatus Pacebacteria bacterium]|nr:WD40 repeat domain-containing protein [Candidatus Paceibacterota bacterium]
MFNLRRLGYMAASLVIIVMLLYLLGLISCGTPGAEKEEAVNGNEKETEVQAELLYRTEGWDEIHSLAFSPDGEVIAVGAREVELYSVVKGEVIRSGDEGDRPESNSLSFSPGGSILAAAWRGAGLYHAENLFRLQHLHGGNECRVAFSPDGKTLASHPNQMHGEIWLWQTENGRDFEKVAEFDPDGDMIQAIEFTPDGAYVAGGFRDGKVRFWEVGTHEPAYTIDFDSSGGNYNLTFSPDGKILAASEPDLGRKIYLFDLEDGTKKRVLDPEGRVSRMQFSADGTRIAYGKFDGTVEILDTQDWSLLYSLDHDDAISGLSFSPNGENLAVGTGAGVLYYYHIAEP